MGSEKTSADKKVVEAARLVAAHHPSGVLVIEDDPDLQWRLARMLTVQGNRVVGTSSGDGALALISQWPVDLVLVDEDLPGMSGLEVAKRIRGSHPHIPVVLMTGADSHETRTAASLAGVVATLIKPLRSEHLAELAAVLALGIAVASPAE
jgi:CheY-like chemotaxis protein